MSPGHLGLIREHSSLALKGVWWGSYRPRLPRRNMSNFTKGKKDDLFINRHDLLLFSH